MNKTLTIIVLAISLLNLGFSLDEKIEENKISNYKLNKEDLPEGYKFISKLNCQSVQPATFYSQIESLYSMFLGEVVYKEFQSFKSKKDQGSILYFQFKDEFEGDAFLKGYLWGENGKPNKQHPEDYAVLDNNILIIWSTKIESRIKQISKAKIK